jgi:hypothetical protein
MGNIPHTDIYEAVSSCEDAREIEGIKIIRYEQSIYYANVDNFLYKVVKNASVDPSLVAAQIKKIKSSHDKLMKKKQKEQVGFQFNFCELKLADNNQFLEPVHLTLI